VDAGDLTEPISPELALVDPELARRARALLPHPAWVEPVAPARSSRARLPRVRRETFVRVAAWLAVPSIALNVAFLRTDSAARPSPVSAPPRVVTVSIAPLAPQTDARVRRRTVRPSQSGVASARHVERHLRVARKVLRWRATARAAAYDVILWRDHRRVADVWTTKPRVTVAAVACRGTTPLAAGRYLWFVYPLVHARPRRYGRLVKWGTLEVPARPRCARRARSAP
jgi:hypothetical protein